MSKYYSLLDGPFEGEFNSDTYDFGFELGSKLTSTTRAGNKGFSSPIVGVEVGCAIAEFPNVG